MKLNRLRRKLFGTKFVCLLDINGDYKVCRKQVDPFGRNVAMPRFFFLPLNWVVLNEDGSTNSWPYIRWTDLN